MQQRFLLAAVVIFAVVPSAASVRAQCAYVPPTTALLGSTPDQVFPVALPFAFPFAGTLWSDITISSNGFVWLGRPGQGARCCQGNAAQFVQDPPSIAILWTALIAGNGSGDGVYYEADPSGSAVRVSWQGVHEPGNTASFQLQMTLFATGQIDFWFDPAVDVTTHDALTGVTAGNGATGTAIVCSTGLPFFSAQTTVYQQFAPNAVDLGGQGISFLPTGPTTWAVIDGGCGPWQSYSAAFLFDRSDEMQALQTNSSLTRAANSVTAATADIAEYFAEHPTGKVLLYEFLGVTVNRIGGAASVYTNAASATSALSLLSPLASGKPLADALCTAKDGLVAFDPAAHAYQRKFYLYCCGGDDGSTVASCRGTAPEATDGNRCSQTAADAQHPTAFSSGSWQDAVCGLIYNQVEVHAYYWDDFAVRVGQVDLVGALCDATGGTIYRVWDAGTGPVVDPWRVSGLARKDFLGTRLSMTHDGIPQIGQTVRIGCRTDNALPYLLGVGFQNTSIGSFALPLSLASFGAPGCTLYSSWDVTDSFLLWHDTKTLHIPQASWLIGLSLYYQGLQPHVLNNQLGAVTSNLLRMTIAP